MKDFKTLNNITGWLVFAIASTVYIVTSEPTASLWDCGEYIATGYKLQVGHPPGAPFFQLLARFFSMFVPTEYVARAVNTLSALSSSFTILFLFWSITHMTRKFFAKDAKLEGGNLIAVIGSGVVGALAYTFSDSFWFSAVEGEVYAMSSFFTAIVFWAMLKWEEASDNEHAFRWLLLIAYLVGLSVGVHLLNLLAIPAIVLVYYYKKYDGNIKGAIIAFILSIILLAFVMYMIIPWLVKFAGIFEKLFVNTFGMPFHSGSIVYFLLIIGGIVYGLYRTQKAKKLVANTIILAFTFITIGYMSFLILVVRSNANTPIDENNPEDATSLLAYLNREQYGDWPIFKGQYYNAPAVRYDDGTPFYTKSYAVVDADILPNPSNIKLGDRGLFKIFTNEQDAQKYLDTLKNPKASIKQAYVLTDARTQRIPVYDPDFVTIFPRMWSNQRSAHASYYAQYIKDKTRRKTISTQDGQSRTEIIPTFGDNLTFFFDYQVGWMYLRYFMWNFSGRQNDIQGHGNEIHGNWITGIKFLDEARLGNQSDIPIELHGNKGHNTYFMLPLILGLIGLYYHFKKNKKDATIVSVLFLMTGLAIIVYLNQSPYQPRERDYAYVASFYAFAIWIGIGVFALYDMLKKYMSPQLTAIAVTAATFALVPVVMAQQNWDDHDRSGRYNTLSIAKNYLESCDQNAILFTNGDNDTFPLWYAQEVENIRTDIKVVNLSLFSTDWYVDQMVRKTYLANPIPTSVDRDKYIQGTNDIAPMVENPQIVQKGRYYNIKDLMKFFWSDDPALKYNSELSYFPTKNFYIPVNKETVLKNGVVPAKDADKIVDSVKWTIKESLLQKNNIMMLDMLSTFDWNRPVYYAITTGSDAYLDLMEYFRLDGMAYRLVPIKSNETGMFGTYGSINTDVLYDRLMNKFDYSGLNNPNLYYDESHMRSIKNYRSNFGRLAMALVKEGKLDKAKKVADRAMELLPEKTVSFDIYMIQIVETYYAIGDKKKGNELASRMLDIADHDLAFYYSRDRSGQYSYEKQVWMVVTDNMSQTGKKYGDGALEKRATEILNKYIAMYNMENGR